MKFKNEPSYKKENHYIKECIFKDSELLGGSLILFDLLFFDQLCFVVELADTLLFLLI